MELVRGLTINEADYNLQQGRIGRVAILIYSGDEDPSKILDAAILTYTQGHAYHELIDANLDNPWMRVILSEINDMNQELFDCDKHRINRRL